MEPQIIQQLEFVLLLRAIIFALAFFVGGWYVMRMPTENKKTVRLVAGVSFLLGLINIIMAIQWVRLFYF